MPDRSSADPFWLDGERWQLFKSRGAKFFGALLFAYGFLIVVYALVGASWWFTGVNCGLFCVVLAIYFSADDPLVYFVITHPTWLFFFSSYLYSAANLQTVDEGLFNPQRSITIAVVYQAACITAFIIFYALQQVFHLRRRPLRQFLALQRHEVTFITIGILGSIIGNLSTETVASVGEEAQLFLWLGAALHMLRRGSFKLDLATVATGVVFVLVAVVTNSRTIVLQGFLFVFLACAFWKKRLVTIESIIAIYLVMCAVNVFSTVTLDIRLNGGRESRISMLPQYADRVFNAETIVAMLNPFSSFPSQRNVRSMGRMSNDEHFWYPYFGASDTLANRAVQLPLLDIVCGTVGAVQEINWKEFENLFMSTLPNLGQKKDLVYSDELTWDLGLRDYGVIGRPMLTNACELYTMGGLGTMYIIATVEFAVVLLLIAILQAQLRYRSLYVITLGLTLPYLTVTTSALAITVGVFRSLPIMIFVIWLMKRATLTMLTTESLSLRAKPRHFLP